MPPFRIQNRTQARVSRTNGAGISYHRGNEFYSEPGRKRRTRRQTQFFSDDLSYVNDPAYGAELSDESEDYDADDRRDPSVPPSRQPSYMDFTNHLAPTAAAAPSTQSPTSEQFEDTYEEDIRILDCTDLYDSSCDEIEITSAMQRLNVHDPARHPRSRAQVEEVPSDPETPSASPNTPQRIPTTRVVTRDRVRTALRRVKNRARSGIGRGMNPMPYPPKNCFACNWENIESSQKPKVLAHFFEFFEGKLAERTLDQHCRDTHILYMKIVYPTLTPGPGRHIWRSWHIKFHLQHHTMNAHAQLYNLCQRALVNENRIYNSLYGPRSLYTSKGVVDFRLARVYLQSQMQVLKLYNTKPDALAYNSPESKFDTRNNVSMITGTKQSSNSEIESLVSLLKLHGRGHGTQVSIMDFMRNVNEPLP